MLELLDGVRHDGRPVAGERSHALLARLAAAEGRAVSEGDLVAAVWDGDAVPAHPGKALQVVVSRTRAQTSSALVERVAGGYRLTGPSDVVVVAAAAREARRAEESGRPDDAERAARAVLAGRVETTAHVPALAELRGGALARQREATAVLGRVLAARGAHAEALPLLESVEHPDEATELALVRSAAGVHGVPAALERFAEYRARLADELGIDPSPAAQALHAELLAADNPVRTGLQYDATSLVGRDDALRRLKALVHESRVTSILGPGGLGKTRLAHLLGREAEQPVVHFVELAGVASPKDVVAEVGSVLGVRDSLTGRRMLSPEQRADIRARIAQHLDQAPTLLILDNCEHVVEAVAELVAPLVATTSRVRVLTTTRAPLAIAAERVFALEQLDLDASVDLFCQRAEAARPGVRLDPDGVARVVRRLDGLRLAIELAAAKVRAMSVADIDRRLDDRFALLRGNDRGAPDRHQTLLAVIEWSWSLLADRDRDALAGLAVFHDGFSLDGAEALLGDSALASLESLAAQSLVTVRDTDAGLRYRLLEMVREFGLLRLGESGRDSDARRALRAWGIALSEREIPGLYGNRQVEAVRALEPEENNLADLVRECLAEPDPDAAVVLVAALSGFWTIRGEHLRVITLMSALDHALDGWDPPAALRDVAARAAGTVVMNTTVAGLPQPPRLRALLRVHGPVADDPSLRALTTVLLAEEAGVSVAELADSDDRRVAVLALQWSSHARENGGDLEGALRESERALGLWREEDGEWMRGLHESQLAGLYAQRGEYEAAARHAEAGLAVLDALRADDDAVQTRAVIALAAIVRGDLATARLLVGEIAAQHRPGMWGGAVVVESTMGELAFAEGDIARGLRHYDDAVASCRSLRFPGLATESGLEPWTLYTESSALAAHARYGRGAAGERLFAETLAKLDRLLAGERRSVGPAAPGPDYPVLGCLVFAVGTWILRRGGPHADPELGVRLLVLGERCGYSRYAPSMRWEAAEALAEERAPGLLGAVVTDLGERRGPDVVADIRAATAQILRP